MPRPNQKRYWYYRTSFVVYCINSAQAHRLGQRTDTQHYLHYLHYLLYATVILVILLAYKRYKYYTTPLSVFLVLLAFLVVLERGPSPAKQRMSPQPFGNVKNGGIDDPRNGESAPSYRTKSDEKMREGDYRSSSDLHHERRNVVDEENTCFQSQGQRHWE